ncbi:DUF4185 domain-containing protein [Rhodococcus spongiicola]|uniref:DUF4185 domain-containing protein n=1 Tax=Rhodococcus spongiicola TaxID=2487352 RepID=A0A438B6D8_9NOCA|nr:DUF4185 domain-containing protein [Rhodococcus spongiicola]RVW06525.1 DUF4185 domain-containing protein [Rhodococcus spongiicola]
MARFVKLLTYDETAPFQMPSTDLGYVAQTNHGYTITLFGDTFDDGPDGHLGQGNGWRSPVGLRQSNPDIENGIRWDNAIGGARAKKMIPYESRGGIFSGELPDGFTNIPNDLIHLPDGRYIMTTFAIRSWAHDATDGNSWATFHSRMWTSTETHAEHWGRTWDVEGNHENFDFPNWGEWSHFQNNTMIMFPGEPWVYIYGTNEGRWQDGGIHLMRVDWRTMWNRSTYEFWGEYAPGVWEWRRFGHTTPILRPTFSGPGQYIGEISAQVIDGRVVLSYVDGSIGAITRTSPRPEGIWTLPKMQISRDFKPTLYAPCIHPYSRLGRAQMLLSEWDREWQPDGPTTYYGTKQWEVDLNGIIFSTSNPRLAEETGNVAEGVVNPEGHTGELTPRIDKLSTPDLVAVLADNADDDIDRSDIAEVVEKGRAASK